MPKVVGVRFRSSPRMYWFAPVGDDEQYVNGVSVVVETQRGIELARVVMLPKEVDESEVVQPLKPVIRIATEQDLQAAKADEAQKQSILATAKEKVAERQLDMKVCDCEFTVDHSKLVLYFTAEQRVDFRELVRDLAQAFHIRIDLRQIGGREECKLVGALGPCGMPCCCGRFESDSEHVSIKMAKTQSLALNPSKINGMCGRLLCCLGYENKGYEEAIKKAPKHGTTVTCPDGRKGSVVSFAPLTEKVKVRIGDDELFEFVDFPLSELNYEGKPVASASTRDNNYGERDKTQKPMQRRGVDKKNERANSQNSDTQNLANQSVNEKRGKDKPFKNRKNKNNNRKSKDDNGNLQNNQRGESVKVNQNANNNVVFDNSSTAIANEKNTNAKNGKPNRNKNRFKKNFAKRKSGNVQNQPTNGGNLNE